MEIGQYVYECIESHPIHFPAEKLTKRDNKPEPVNKVTDYGKNNAYYSFNSVAVPYDDAGELYQSLCRRQCRPRAAYPS